MNIKQFVSSISAEEYSLIRLHVSIQDMFCMYIDNVYKDYDEEWTIEEFANVVINSNDELNQFDLEKVLKLIETEYVDELKKLNDLIVANQKPQTWAYLTKLSN